MRNKCTRSWIGSRVKDTNEEDGISETTNIKMREQTTVPISPSLSLYPSIPREQVFPAVLTHIDCNGVVWVVPLVDNHLRTSLSKELHNYSKSSELTSPGTLVVAEMNG